MGTDMLFMARWDHFLGDEARSSELDDLGEFRPASATANHWFDFSSHPGSANPIERLIQRVFVNIGAIGCAVDCRGVEYWANVLREGQNLRWHFDKDEALWQKARQMRHPLVSSVYYPAHCVCEGGELVINSHSVSPTPDTLVVFAGHLRHCVRIVTKGVRWSIAMNFWATVPEGIREASS
jgi:predicted 2-oxoglutarate/Fe(II)-dependent dioxygenase YbiX